MKRLAIALCTTLGLTVGTSAQVSEQDSLALVALYDATDGAGWTDQTGWLSAAPCSWYGVFCTDGAITELSLSGNRLSGSIPPELGDLDSLRVLDLGSNQISGPIPPELGNLSLLTRLSLGQNPLGGTLPPELGNLSKLEVLLLGSAGLTGPLPAELGNLSQLGYLFLQLNELSGPIPPELGNLSNLWWVELDHNRLSGALPPELGRLANVQLLDLCCNAFSGEIPPELGDLTTTPVSIWLFENQLSGEIPPELGNAFLLQLWLQHNRLGGPIPPELGELADLQSLRLNDNLFAGTLPATLVHLTNLDDFFFQNTDLCESADPAFQNWLSGIENLQSTGCTSVATEEGRVDLPRTYGLQANYPNPFDRVTTIRYALPQRASVRLVVYDALGRTVRVLVAGERDAGVHDVVFDASALPDGPYLYRLETPQGNFTRPMLLMK